MGQDKSNPITWDCGKNGEKCFNKLCRPKIELFGPYIPRSGNFGDVDGQLERNGFSLQLEWKPNSSIKRGQEIAYTNLSKTGLVSVLCVIGDAYTMKTTHMCSYVFGIKSMWKRASLADVGKQVESWWAWTEKNKKAIPEGFRFGSGFPFFSEE